MTLTVPTSLGHEAVIPRAAHKGPLRRELLSGRVQFTYSTRFVSAKVQACPASYELLAGEDVVPAPGDVVIARISGIANHKRVETETSRKAIIYEGALVALAYGHRYAADQFLAHVPGNLGRCHLVAAGGVAGTVTQVHALIDAPTGIEPLGLLCDADGVVNLLGAAPYQNVPVAEAPVSRPEVIAMLGTSMNSGKSTVMSCLVNGLTNAGYRVGAGKVTGTGAGNDRMHYFDAGANEVIDFTDFGYATTFRLDYDAVRALTVNMVDVLSRGNDIVLIEIADGICQEETAALLRDDVFHHTVDQVGFAAIDALGARAGVDFLTAAGLKVGLVSGVLTSSPLATAEAAALVAESGVPVIGTFDLTAAEVAKGLTTR